MEKNQSNFLISSFALRACIQKKIKEEEKKLYIFEAMNLIKLKYPKIITDVQYKEALGKGNLYITKLENDSNGYYHFSTSDIHVSSDNIDSSDKILNCTVFSPSGLCAICFSTRLPFVDITAY